VRFPNPLIPGFSPDPSVVAADGAYYLVTSTFEYLPGIPVYRSTDLVTWTHIGNVATRSEQAPVDDVATGGGVWAPTIRYRDGVCYVIVTIAMSARGCVVFTATDPAGPWSDGITIVGVGGVDPDLAWDQDGTAYRLSITGRTGLDDPHPQFVGRRQRHLSAAVSVTVDASGGTGGLAARYDEDHWFCLEARGTVVTARDHVAGLVYHDCRAAPVRGAAQVAAPSYEVGTSMNASAAEASSSPHRHHPVWAVAATYR
jgi:beta-xylosidase